ncbi:hypothetical protein [Mycolicibacterium komossense]|uniref:Uncharacterized protein n=1 Tax=Mycolicibacterium komossense TaxID=1779 RepID=A0ABT3C6D5_9MYCO|nr:hypothetical protein [Mycolicibacterium komossense]MCV7224776.1 hypothetical protein [Mycolicibacterium komossense]
MRLEGDDRRGGLGLVARLIGKYRDVPVDWAGAEVVRLTSRVPMDDDLSGVERDRRQVLNGDRTGVPDECGAVQTRSAATPQNTTLFMLIEEVDVGESDRVFGALPDTLDLPRRGPPLPAL